LSLYSEELARVKELLRSNPRGMTITEMSREIKINRNSVAKYLDVLLISGQVEMKQLGPAKLFYLSQRVPMSAMLNITSDYIALVNERLVVTQMNDNLLNLAGLEREDVIGKLVTEIRHPFLKETDLFERIHKAMDGDYSTFELHYTDDGTDRYFNIKLFPATFEDGNKGVTLSMEDISERKLTEIALRERVKELDCLYKLSQLVADAGLDEKKLFNGVVSCIPPAWQFPDFTSARMVVHDRTYESPGFQEYDHKQEVKILVGDEKVGVLEVFVSEDAPIGPRGPFLPEESYLIEAVARRLGSAIERIEAERRLKESQEKYSAVVENTNEGTIIVQDGKIQFANKASLKLVGYTPEELFGSDFIQYVAAEDRELARKRYLDRMKGLDVPRLYEVNLIRKDGGKIRIEANANLFYYNDKPADIVFIRDITERLKYRERLEALHSHAINLALTSDVDEIAETTLDAIEMIFKVEDIEFIVARDRVLELIERRGPGTSVRKVVPFNETGIITKAARTGRSILLQDVREDPDYFQARSKTLSELTVPVKINDHVQAVINLESPNVGAFTLEDQKLLEIFAGHIASAMRRMDSP
jgi:PAS domain S-box-containing protein